MEGEDVFDGEEALVSVDGRDFLTRPLPGAPILARPIARPAGESLSIPFAEVDLSTGFVSAGLVADLDIGVSADFVAPRATGDEEEELLIFVVLEAEAAVGRVKEEDGLDLGVSASPFGLTADFNGEELTADSDLEASRRALGDAAVLES